MTGAAMSSTGEQGRPFATLWQVLICSDERGAKKREVKLQNRK